MLEIIVVGIRGLTLPAARKQHSVPNQTPIAMPRREALHPVTLLLVVAGLHTAGLTGRAAENETVWQAGAASVQITPAEMTWMAGYASRNKPAQGVPQDLLANALDVQD